MTSEEIKLITETVSKSVTDNISHLIDEKLKPINDRLDSIEERLDKVEEDIDIIKENTDVTRAVTNELVEWVDYNFRDKYPFPVEKVKIV